MSAVACTMALGPLFGACGGGDSGPLEDAGVDGLESGVVHLALGVQIAGREGGNLDIELSGPFRVRGWDRPQVDLTATVEGRVEGETIDLEARVTLLKDRGFIEYRGTVYEIDSENLATSEEAFLPPKPGTEKKAGVSALSACLETAADVDVEALGDEFVEEGTARVEGTPTTKVGADLDAEAVRAALASIAEDPSCKAQLAVASRLVKEVEALADETAGAVEKAHVEVFTGEDDVVRRIVGQLTVEPTGDRGRTEVDFELTLTEVNENPEIVAPREGVPVLFWLERLGFNPLSALFLFSEREGLGRLLERVAADAF